VSTYLSFPLTTLFTKRPIDLSRRHHAKITSIVSGGPDLVWLLLFACFLRPVGTPFSSARSGTAACLRRYRPDSCSTKLPFGHLISVAETDWTVANSPGAHSVRPPRASVLLPLSSTHHSSGEIQAEATVVCLFRYARPVRRESSTCHSCRVQRAKTKPDLTSSKPPISLRPSLTSLVAFGVASLRCLPIITWQGSRSRCTNFSAPVRCAPH